MNRPKNNLGRAGLTEIDNLPINHWFSLGHEGFRSGQEFSKSSKLKDKIFQADVFLLRSRQIQSRA